MNETAFVMSQSNHREEITILAGKHKLFTPEDEKLRNNDVI